MTTTTEETTMDTTTWAVIDVRHLAVRDVRPVCQECLELAANAKAHAQVTGSRKATYEAGGHFATVIRTIAPA